MVAIDWALAKANAENRIRSISSLNADFIALLDQRLVQVRDGLGVLDAMRAINCNSADLQASAELVVKWPQLKTVATETPDGVTACATLQAIATPLTDFMSSATDLSSFERIDVVSFGVRTSFDNSSGQLSLRLQRRPANSVNRLVAIVPLAELVSGFEARASNAAGITAVRLMFGTRRLMDVTGEPGAADANVPALLAGSEVGMAESVSSEASVTLTDHSHLFPLSVVTTAERFPNGRFDGQRILTDFALGAAMTGFLLGLFIRRQEEVPSVGRFEQAMRREQFDVAYRPIVDLHSGKLSGAIVEILWRQTSGDLLPSREFMPLVIKSGFEPQMLRFVLQRSQEGLAQTYKLRPRLRLKIPVDHSTLVRPGFIDQIRRGLNGASLRPSQLVLAFKRIESAKDPVRSQMLMRDLQRLGVQLEMSGSAGETGFGVDMTDISVSSVCIDPNLLEALGSPLPYVVEQARAWIRTIVDAAAIHSVKVIAQDIKSVAVVRQLKELGVDEIEGDAISPSLSAGSFMALVARAGMDMREASDLPDTEQRQGPGSPRRQATGL